MLELEVLDHRRTKNLRENLANLLQPLFAPIQEHGGKGERSVVMPGQQHYRG